MGGVMWPSDAASSSHGHMDSSTEATSQHQPQPDEHTSLLNPAPWPLPAATDDCSSSQAHPPAPIATAVHAPGLTVVAFTEQLQSSERTPLVMGIPASTAGVPLLPMPGTTALRSLGMIRKPTDTKVIVIHYPGRLDVIIPPPGFTGGTLFLWFFAIAWNVFCAFFTFGALASRDAGSLVAVLFSIPFWCVGVFVVRAAIAASYTQQRLALRADKYRLGPESTLRQNRPDFLDSPTISKKVVEGCTAYLSGAAASDHVLRDSDGDERRVNCLYLMEGGSRHMFGQGLDGGELQWMVYEINTFLDATRRLGAQASAAACATAYPPV